jgi:hypothetical protein
MEACHPESLPYNSLTGRSAGCNTNHVFSDCVLFWGRAAMWIIRTVSPKSNPPNTLNAVWLNPA